MPIKCQEPQIFYICKPYLFLHIYDPFSIPHLQSCLFGFIFANTNEVFTAIHKLFTLKLYTQLYV